MDPAAPVRSPWKLAAAPLAAGLCARILTVAVIQSLHGNFLFLDDQGYDRTGWSLAQAWHLHYFAQASSVQYAGSVSDAWYFLVAGVYFVLGHHWLVVKLIVAVLSALAVPAAASIGDSLGGDRLGRRAAWLAALYPTAVFWGATGLKDGVCATLLLTVAAIAMRPPSMRRIAVAAAIIPVAFLLRPVLAAAGLIMLAAAALEWCRPASTGRRMPVLLLGIPALAVASALAAARYLPAIRAVLAGGDLGSAADGPVTVSFIPSGHDAMLSLLGPFPWSPASGAYLALYPGMIIWIAMLPAIALGCRELLRHESWAARGAAVSALAYLYLYMTVFQGDGFYRQRFTAELILMTAGLYAFQKQPGRAAIATALGAFVIVPAALIQARTLAPEGIALTACAAGTLLISQARTARRRTT